MKRYLEDVIKRIYIEKDYDFFINQCHKKLDFIDELKNITDKITTNIIEPDLIYDPYIEVRYKYDLFEKGEFKVSYDSTLNISKITPIFFIKHEFKVTSVDINRIEPKIRNYSPHPYSKHQDDLHKIVSSFLVNKGYKELSFNEIEEVIPYLKMPGGINRLFGSQMTLETALFNDLYEINPEEENQ